METETHDYVAEIVNAYSQPKKILLIDDNPEDCLQFKQYCGRHLCEVEEVSNGIDGIRMAVTKEYNLVLVDLVMPGLSGLETIKQIKVIKRAQNKVQGITALSGVYTQELIQSLQKVGCVVFAHKPDCFSQIYMDDLLGTFGIPSKQTAQEQDRKPNQA
jgi:CheY-like chemotaxis protein